MKCKIGVAASMVLLSTTLMVGCSSSKNLNTAYFINSDSWEVESKLSYRETNRLVEIKLAEKVELPENTRVYVSTPTERYSATIIGDKLIYIGESPTEETPVQEVYYEQYETIIVTKDMLKLEGENYIYIFDGKDVNSITMTSDNGEFIPIEFIGGKYQMTVAANIYDKTSEFQITVSRKIAISI